ncbi:MAG: glycosyltransferase family 2 protein [Candidatus Riflebacteria bacterium]|nr:glycosyltransferase family 2 protein [Candidatus Riflebacteria bacterium]
MTAPAHILVIIPAFNEAGNLPRTLRTLLANLPPHTLPMVVDDGSADDTARVARDLGVLCLKLPIHLGYGGALQTGYKYALQAGFSFLVQMDADGQHDPTMIPRILDPLLAGEADCVIGNRYHPGSDYQSPLLRRIGRRFFSWMIGWFSGIPPQDPTSGFRAYNRKALALLTRDHFPLDFPDADVYIMMRYAGVRMREVDVIMHPPPGTKSMHSGFFHPVRYCAKMLMASFMIFLRHMGGLSFWKAD